MHMLRCTIMLHGFRERAPPKTKARRGVGVQLPPLADLLGPSTSFNIKGTIIALDVPEQTSSSVARGEAVGPQASAAQMHPSCTALNRRGIH